MPTKKPRPTLNCIYCIKLQDSPHGQNCYKLGASSTDAGRIWKRAAEVRTSSKLATSLIRWVYTGPANAKQAEQEMLALGTPTTHAGWPGYKEVRILSESDVQSVYSIMEKYAIPYVLETKPDNPLQEPHNG